MSNKCLLLPLLAASILRGQSTLNLTGGTVRPGEQVTLSLGISSVAGTEPACPQWTLSYPSANFGAVTTVIGAAGTAASKDSMECSAASGQYICVLSGMNQNKILNGVMALITLTAKPGQGKSSQTVTVGGTVAATPGGDATPMSGASAVVNINPPMCDVNGNGTFDTTDVAQSRQMSVGAIACTADVNGDGVCNAVDTQRVVNAVLMGTCREGP